VGSLGPAVAAVHGVQDVCGCGASDAIDDSPWRRHVATECTLMPDHGDATLKWLQVVAPCAEDQWASAGRLCGFARGRVSACGRNVQAALNLSM